jgi:hypothetical protein
LKVKVTKHTGLNEARRAIEATMPAGFISKAELQGIYTWMHSPIRTQIFEIELIDIKSFVSVHLVRHVTVTPFVTSKRTDRGGSGKEDRNSLVNTTLWCNAEALINIAQKRLCYQASKETRDVVRAIQTEIRKVDPDLARYMVPQCVFRGGYCCEPRACGNYPGVKKYNPKEIWLKIMGGPEA